jgi:hypothetical protein
MKKATLIFLLLFYLLSMTCHVLAGTTGNVSYYSFSTVDLPDRFTAYGMTYDNDHPPFHRLQNMMEFHFTDGKEIHEKYTASYGRTDTEYGPSEHILDLYLTYNKSALMNNDPYFITGTFTYSHEYDGSMANYEGTVSGYLVYSTDTENIGVEFNADKNAIMLYLTTADGSLFWNIFLETGDDSWLTYNKENVDYGSYPHLPSSSEQTDVAVGIGISTFGAAVVNVLTKTSMSGAISLNLPSSAIPGPVPSAAPASSTVSGSSGFFGALKKLFGSILKDLKDILTDEGRSYAGGKITEKIENIEK